MRGRVVVHTDDDGFGCGGCLRGRIGDDGAMACQRRGLVRRAVPHMHVHARLQQQAGEFRSHLAEADHGYRFHLRTPFV
ncbi:hypothetical protein OJJOAM_001761 [Cupriavidus sp. H18C1]